MVISEWLKYAKQKISSVGIKSAELDAELIAGFILGRERTWLRAFGEEILNQEIIDELELLLEKRLNFYPIAYILGFKNFYGRDFFVNENTLIPRPETEDLVEITLSTAEDFSGEIKILDVGTGSGCIPVTLALENPRISASGVDISEKALKVANENAKNLNAKVDFWQSNLLKNIPENIKYDIITANLPYVDESWKTSKEITHEPSLALFAENKGLDLIYKLITQAPQKLKSDSRLILESDPCQHREIIDFATKYGFELKYIKNYITVFKLNLN